MILQNAHYIPIFADDGTDFEKGELPDILKVFSQQAVGDRFAQKCAHIQSPSPFHLKV